MKLLIVGFSLLCLLFGDTLATEVASDSRASPIDALAAPSAPGGSGGGLPAIPGGTPSGPIMILGSFQAVMAPMDPAMISAIMGGATSGGFPGLPKPPGTKK